MNSLNMYVVVLVNRVVSILKNRKEEMTVRILKDIDTLNVQLNLSSSIWVTQDFSENLQGNTCKTSCLRSEKRVVTIALKPKQKWN